MRVNNAFSTIVLLLSICSFSLKAEEIPILNLSQNPSHNKDFTVALTIDSSRSMHFEDIVKLSSQADLTNSRFTIPSIVPDYWFVFKVRNHTKHPVKRIIGFDEACMETVDIYYPEDSTWIHKTNGLLSPVNERDIYHRWPLFELTIEAGETKPILLKMHSKYVVPVGIICETPSTFRKVEKNQAYLYFLYFGAAIAIAIYNLFLFISLKDKAYLYYISYVLLLVLWILLYSGFFLYFNSNTELYYFLSFGACAMGGFIALFTRELLKPKTFSKGIDKALLLIALFYFIYSILIVIDISFYQYLGTFSMPFSIFLALVGVLSLTKKVALAKFYIFGSIAYLIGLFLIAGLTLGLISYSFASRFGFMIGSLIELVVFSLALAYRIKLLQTEKISYQKQIIENQESVKEQLEIQVQERTIKLEESNKAKDKLFSIISHDLRGPFNSILGLMEISKEKKNSISEEKKDEYLELTYKSTEQVYATLDNLLLWARTQTEGINFQAKEHNIVHLIEEVVELNSLNATHKDIEINYEGANSHEIICDEEMIKTVLRNLLSNAIKFTPKGGHIKLSSHISANKPDAIIISIEDSGLGMNQDTINKLFQVEKNKSTKGTDEESGTGLGLIICKELIEKHSGEIWAESKLGNGSTFSFSLPRISKT